ncbi:MAG TPA: FAD binding domain-containing protein [Rhodopila sp.]|uniref:FAD binding domain-containing protein n=1 Tax=Rhodopila sp. TaxID=2480087 RepID=UPI002CAB22A3|nr:FAD binding domain-containing protein [Rhodopila sp.]HVY15821.1 FAD binding domain-containing protein [Rhodopila sp.]
MKAADFTLVRPTTLADALAALRAPEARVIAGGQSLAPMLNLRLARPETLVAVGTLPELAGASETVETITLGAGTTHAAIADGRTPDLPGGILARVAEGIAYRAIRNRGTIGGSLCHADPAADWPTVLSALGASVVVAGPAGTRTAALPGFIAGAFRVALDKGELVQAVRIPKPSAGSRWGYYKACRKPGEFAHAMAAVLIDGAVRRGVIGAVGGAPILLPDLSEATARTALEASGLDPMGRQMQVVAFRRALAMAGTGTGAGAGAGAEAGR